MTPGETLKYLYLLFDGDNFLQRSMGYVLSTEGHPMKTQHNGIGSEQAATTLTCPYISSSAIHKVIEQSVQLASQQHQPPGTIASLSSGNVLNIHVERVAVVQIRGRGFVYEGLASTFGPALKSKLKAPVLKSEPFLACSAIPKSLYEGSIVVAERGKCSFVEKIRNLQDAGALAVIVQDSVDGNLPITMSCSPEEVSLVQIPSLFVTLQTGQQLQNRIHLGPTFLELDPAGDKLSVGDRSIIEKGLLSTTALSGLHTFLPPDDLQQFFKKVQVQIIT